MPIIENGFYLCESFGNTNVPEGAEIIGSLATMSGEIIETYYKKGEKYYKVCDWSVYRPVEVSIEEIKDKLKKIRRRENETLSFKNIYRKEVKQNENIFIFC